MKRLNDFCRSLSEEQKSLLGFSTVLVFLLALLFFIFVPMVEEALLTKEECLKLEAKLANYKALSQKQDYVKVSKEQSEKLQTLEKRLPQNLKQDDVMGELHSLAGKSSVKLNALRQTGKEYSKKQSIPLYLECSGAYGNVLKFLEALENEGSFKKLSEVQIKGEERTGNLELVAVVIAYKN